MTISFSAGNGEYCWYRGTLYELGSGDDSILGTPAWAMEACSETDAYKLARLWESEKTTA